MTRAVGLVVAVLLLAVGAATALATVAVHRSWWGLVLGLAATLASMWALGPGWTTRLPFGLGWAGLVAGVAPTRPEGDYVLASDLPGYAVLAAAVAVLVGSVATLPRRGRAPDTGQRGVDS